MVMNVVGCNGVAIGWLDITVPSELKVHKIVAVVYSVVPWVLVVAVIAMLCIRRTVVLLMTVHLGLLVVIVNEKVFKPMLQLPRPVGSCLASQGMPSSHSALSAAMITWATLEISHRVSLVRLLGNACCGTHTLESIVLTTVYTLLAPVPASRVAVRDHSLEQVLVGALVGGLVAALYFALLKRYVSPRLSRWCAHRYALRLSVRNDYN